MSEDTNKKSEEQKKKIDPQEDEKDGNVFGEAFDKVFGDEENKDANDPDKQGSLKD